ncbi:hypothetical protein E2C01_023858 [Portunus trituberculatus]|uniref:Uncharacterized protein n=1 Tax=Portunus trituberculatus TaxID=210409 RepID=A0A5B7E922_PORTR|nr:hypothetical protein [Portunus trituberculatus]
MGQGWHPPLRQPSTHLGPRLVGTQATVWQDSHVQEFLSHSPPLISRAESSSDYSTLFSCDCLLSSSDGTSRLSSSMHDGEGGLVLGTFLKEGILGMNALKPRPRDPRESSPKPSRVSSSKEMELIFLILFWGPATMSTLFSRTTL